MMKILYMIRMPLDKSLHYVYRIGSDNQYRIHWKDNAWRYEFLAGGVLFDEQSFDKEERLIETLIMAGIPLDQFRIDHAREGEAYSAEIQTKMKRLIDLGIDPCPKHGLSSKNDDGTCEACSNTDYPDDFKGTEG